MKLLAFIYRARPAWWHFWNLNNPPGAVLLFFLAGGWAVWCHDGRLLPVGFLLVAVPGAIAYRLLGHSSE